MRPRLLTPDDVAEVRALYSQGLSMEALGEQFGVSWGTIRNALHPKQRRGPGAPRLLTTDQREAIRELRRGDPQTWTYRRLADQFMVSQSLISKIITGSK